MNDGIDLNLLARLLPRGWWLKIENGDDSAIDVLRLQVGTGEFVVLMGYRNGDAPRRPATSWHFLCPIHVAPWGMVREIKGALSPAIEVRTE